MNAHRRAGVLAAVLVLGVAPGLAGPAAATGGVEPSAAPAPSAPAALQLDDAQLRWGINDETQNRAFAPGTVNFLSAGVVPDPGSGGNTVRDGRWTSTGAPAWWSQVGDVSIQKRQPGGSWAPATFAGLSTQADGTPLGSPTSGTTSGHQVVLDGGTGVVDPVAGTADLQWRGSFSVLSYSGMSFFTVTDPRLQVTPAGGTLTGQVAGYASDMEDTSRWAPVAAERVVLADLPATALPETGGLAATPRYLQVPWDGGGQVRDGAVWGAFPTSFLQQLSRIGSAAYWFSSGGSTDPLKVARPLTLSYDADDPVPVSPETPTAGGAATGAAVRPPNAPAPPSTRTSRRPDATPTATPTATPSATPSTTGTDVVTDPVAAPRAGGLASLPPADGGSPVAAAPTTDPGLRSAPTIHALVPTAATTGTDSDHHGEWWLGLLLLLGAAGTSLLTHRPTPRRSGPTGPTPPKGTP